MRYSKVLGKTHKEDFHAILSKSYSLLERIGFVRQVGQGLFSFLPLGMRVIKNFQALIAEEMEKIGGRARARLSLSGRKRAEYKNRSG